MSVRLKLTKDGRRLFARAQRVRVRVTGTVVDPVGATATYSRVFTLGREGKGRGRSGDGGRGAR